MSLQQIRPGTQLGAGCIVQVVTSAVTTIITASATMLTDNSIPQIGEGTEIVTVTITPTSATNRLRVYYNITFGSNINANMAHAIFRDSTADAKAAACMTMPANTWLVPITNSFEEVAGSTSATTYRLRVGNNGSGTFWANSAAGATLLYGGADYGSMTVMEVSA